MLLTFFEAQNAATLLLQLFVQSAHTHLVISASSVRGTVVLKSICMPQRGIAVSRCNLLISQRCHYAMCTSSAVVYTDSLSVAPVISNATLKVCMHYTKLILLNAQTQ
jgi:hypothetical protein